MSATLPFDSLVLGDLVGTPEMRAVWTDEGLLGSWMAVERAVAEAEAELGIIPESAAAELARMLSSDALKPEAVAEKRRTAGHLMVSFLQAFHEACGAAAEHLHVGLTTQDVLDTGLVLQMRRAHAIVLRGARAVEEVLCEQALRHADTLMMGRTHEQHAVPLTLGFVLAGWAAEMADHVDRMREAEPRWLRVSAVGSVGARNALVELAGAERARRVEELVAEKLELGVAPIDLQSRSDRFAEPVLVLSQLCGSLAKFGSDVRSLQRSEVMELEEPHAAEQHWSSTMPNKKNPEASEHLPGLAALAAALAGALSQVRVADKRDATRLPVQMVAVPQVFLLAARALETAHRIFSGLVVHADRMRANLDHPNVLGQAAAERVMIALYRRTGRTRWAHGLLHACARRSREQGRPLREVLAAEPAVREHLSAEELERLCDLRSYTGTASRDAREAVAALRRRRERTGQ